MIPDVPAILAFHLGEPNGSAHRIVWDGRVVRYTRWREGFEPLREADYVPDAAAWARFGRAIDKLGPGAWAPRYEAEAGDPSPAFRRPQPQGLAWSLELAWGDRQARTSGEGAWPADFAGLKRALWALLGDPPAI